MERASGIEAKHAIIRHVRDCRDIGRAATSKSNEEIVAIVRKVRQIVSSGRETSAALEHATEIERREEQEQEQELIALLKAAKRQAVELKAQIACIQVSGSWWGLSAVLCSASINRVLVMCSPLVAVVTLWSGSIRVATCIALDYPRGGGIAKILSQILS